MGARERRKGANGEREFFRELDLQITRNLSQSRSGGSDGAGGILEEAETAIEVKRQEVRRLTPWFAQVEAACVNGETPAVAHRASRGDWRVYISMDIREFRDWLRWKAAKKVAN